MKSTSPDPPPAIDTVASVLDETEVAKRVGMSVASVRHWRVKKTGPRFYKIGAAVRYRPEDVDAWIEGMPQQDYYNVRR